MHQAKSKNRDDFSETPNDLTKSKERGHTERATDVPSSKSNQVALEVLKGHRETQEAIL